MATNQTVKSPLHQDFLSDLLRATELVERVTRSDISIENFQAEYDDYYYAAALDGHEGGVVGALLPTIRPVVELHRDVQTILDAVYLPQHGLALKYEAAGRINAAEAKRRLMGLASSHDLAQLISALHRREG